MELFYLLNAVFFGLLVVIWTLQFLFGNGGVPYKVVPIWLASFVWVAYCIQKVVA